MALSAQQIIESFEGLPESEKQRVAYEILRRSVYLDVPPSLMRSLSLQPKTFSWPLTRENQYND